MTFMQTLREQRWDDHRYYHQSRINQSLHLVSAISFLVAYAWLFVDPAMAAIIRPVSIASDGWMRMVPPSVSATGSPRRSRCISATD